MDTAQTDGLPGEASPQPAGIGKPEKAPNLGQEVSMRSVALCVCEPNARY
ncbi:MAG TPA: hypothetical protein VMY43_00790 [Methanothrix sp.]|nr:hypothetical protein [Methanothrix sp.]